MRNCLDIQWNAEIRTSSDFGQSTFVPLFVLFERSVQNPNLFSTSLDHFINKKKIYLKQSRLAEIVRILDVFSCNLCLETEQTIVLLSAFSRFWTFVFQRSTVHWLPLTKLQKGRSAKIYFTQKALRQFINGQFIAVLCSWLIFTLMTGGNCDAHSDEQGTATTSLVQVWVVQQ